MIFIESIIFVLGQMWDNFGGIYIYPADSKCFLSQSFFLWDEFGIDFCNYVTKVGVMQAEYKTESGNFFTQVEEFS